MAKFRAPFLYTETRLNLDQGYTGSTVDITLPSSSTSTFGYSQEAKRAVISDVQVGSDEATFARDHLASDGSIYFRRDGRYPRSFLWRLLDDRRVLEVQSVDLSQDSTEKTEALLTLLLRFPAAIRPLCIAFGDPDERDALNVFAITAADELWTLTLHKDFFVHLKATESLTLEWCKVAIPSIFRVARPYRLFASNARELFVSLVDGGIARLTRKAGEDGSFSP
jgi:DNA repair protein RAD51/nuclear pore complex protein Nup160